MPYPAVIGYKKQSFTIDQPKFPQRRRQVAMFMARVAEFDQGEPLQLVQVRPTFGLNLEAKLVA
jgi:hypothetical protein